MVFQRGNGRHFPKKNGRENEGKLDGNALPREIVDLIRSHPFLEQFLTTLDARAVITGTGFLHQQQSSPGNDGIFVVSELISEPAQGGPSERCEETLRPSDRE